jgi:hypothetical protein
MPGTNVDNQPNIAALGGVLFANLLDGQILAYNATLGVWYNRTTIPATAGVDSVNGVTGAVVLTTPNSTLSVGVSGQNVTLDINLAHANLWTAAQTFYSSDLLLTNPAHTFSYTFAGAAITAARTISLPLLTGNDTMAVLGHAQTFTALQTIIITAGTDGLLLSNNASATAVVNQGVDIVEDGKPLTLALTNFGVSGTTNSPAVKGLAARGSLAAPTAVQTGDLLLSLAAGGYNGSAMVTGARARVGVYAGENWTTTHNGTYLSFWTTAIGAVAPVEWMRLTGAGGLVLYNPAATQSYTILGAAIAGSHTLTLPLITGNDTLAALGVAQSWGALQTFDPGDLAWGGYGADLITSAAAGDIWYYDGTNIVNLPIGAPTNVLTVSGSNLPEWTAGGSGGVSSVTADSSATLTISPTTGAVLAGVNQAGTFSWTGSQTFTTVPQASVSADTTTTGFGTGALATPPVGSGVAGNTAFGYNALHLLAYNPGMPPFPPATGLANTAIGYEAMAATVSDKFNTAIGYSALAAINGGQSNTVVGAYAFSSLTSGSGITAIGASAGNLATGGTNLVAIGTSSLFQNTSGTDNIGVGYGSVSTTTGSGNVGLGSYSLQSQNTGSYVTGLGYFTNVSADGFSNSTALGAYAYITGSNLIQLGSISGVNGASATANLSTGGVFLLYNNIAVIGAGVPYEVAGTLTTPVALQTGSTAIASYSVAVNGQFLVLVSVVSTSSAITGTITVTYHDPTVGGTATQSAVVAALNSGRAATYSFLCNATTAAAIAVAGTAATNSDLTASATVLAQ